MLQRKLYFWKDPEGVQHFPGGGGGGGGGVQLFPRGGGIQMLISIETHFPGGVRSPPPIPPPSGSAYDFKALRL